MISSYNIVNDISQIVSGLGELTSHQLQYMSNEDYQAYINNITDWQELTNLWTQLNLLHKNATYTYNMISQQVKQMGSSAPESLIKEVNNQAAFANSASEKIALTIDKLDSAIRSTASAWVQSSKTYGATLSDIYRLVYLLNEAGLKKNNSAYTQYLSEYESAVNNFNNNILPDLFQRANETISTAAERIVEEIVNEAVQQTELSEEEIADFQKMQSDFRQALEERQQAEAEAEAAKLAAEVAERQRQAAEASSAKLAAEVAEIQRQAAEEAERQRQAKAEAAEAERQRQQAEADAAQKAAEAQQLDELTAEELEKLNKLKDDLKREKEKRQQTDTDETATEEAEKTEKIKKYVRYGLVAVLLLLLFSDDDKDNKKKV